MPGTHRYVPQCINRGNGHLINDHPQAKNSCVSRALDTFCVTSSPRHELCKYLWIPDAWPRRRRRRRSHCRPPAPHCAPRTCGNGRDARTRVDWLPRRRWRPVGTSATHAAPSSRPRIVSSMCHQMAPASARPNRATTARRWAPRRRFLKRRTAVVVRLRRRAAPPERNTATTAGR